MGVSVVTGVGPRTGTSFVMCEASNAGMRVSGERFSKNSVRKHNPDGYWDVNIETYQDDLNTEKWDGTVVKLWGQSIPMVGNDKIDRIVVLERDDKDEQLESIRRVLKDEMSLEANQGIELEADSVLSMFICNMNEWLKTIDKQKIMRVKTHDLTSQIENVLHFLRGDL